MNSPIVLSSSRLYIRLLGGFSIYLDGKILPGTAIKGRKAKALLKLIAHQRQYQIVRDYATDTLWPHLGQDAANAQLYKALHHIRKAFKGYSKDKEEWICITDNLIQLCPPGGVTTDVNLFEIRARKGLKNNNIPDLEHAFSKYTGEFLPTDRFAAWASFSREHYRQLYLDVLTSLATAYENQGELSEAAEMMRLALEKEPTLETAHRGLMYIFAKNGQSTRAFHQYDICRHTLSSELGISPSPETKKALDDILEGKFNYNKVPQNHRPTVSTVSSPIVGRKKECAAMDLCLDNLSQGYGSSIVIHGEAGMGKTRMVQELIRKARKKQLPLFLGGSNAETAKMVFGAFIELFRDILQKAPGMKEVFPYELGALIPGFPKETKKLPNEGAFSAKGRLFAEVHSFFCKLTLKGPTIIVLEDLHSSDQESKALLSYLIKHRRRLPILLVTTLRTEAGDSSPEFVLDLQDYPMSVFELASLTYEEHLQLLQLETDNQTIEKDTAQQLYQLAEGNPFYTLELLRHYTEQEETAFSTQQESAGIYSTFVSKTMPSSISNIINQKLRKLSPAGRHLLKIAAVIGKQPSYDLLAAIWSGRERFDAEGGIFTAIEEAIHGQFLEKHGLDYFFCHALVQESIYASISAARRQVLHKQVAEWLSKTSADAPENSPELIAWHYLRAKDWLNAAKHLKLAGQRAEKVHAHENALVRYTKACELLGREKSSRAMKLNCCILERIGDVYRACGQLERCYDAYEKAIHFARKVGSDSITLVELHRKLAVAAIFRREIHRCKMHLNSAFENAGDNPRLQPRLLITEALYFWHLDCLKKAFDLSKRALVLAKKTDAKAEASHACEILAMTCLPLGRWKEGLKYERELQTYGRSPEILIATDLHSCLGAYHISESKSVQSVESFLEPLTHQALQGEALHTVPGPESVEHPVSPASTAYAMARECVLHTLNGDKDRGWRVLQEGFVYAMQAGLGDHCLRRLYAVGLWNRLEAGEVIHAGEMVKQTEKLLAKADACAACALELYPWFSYYFLQTKQIEKVSECYKLIYNLSKKTGNPVGKAIALMIKSSLCITEMKWRQAEQHSQKSFKILKEAIPATARAPIAQYLDRMLEQQAALIQA